MNDTHDVYGREVKVGSYVVYSSNGNIDYGKILSFESRPGRYNPHRSCPKIGIIGYRSTRKGYLWSLDETIVVDSVPVEIKEKLDAHKA